MQSDAFPDFFGIEEVLGGDIQREGLVQAALLQSVVLIQTAQIGLHQSQLLFRAVYFFRLSSLLVAALLVHKSAVAS